MGEETKLRHYNDLPENDRLALLDLLVEYGALDQKLRVTPLGEQYIITGSVAPDALEEYGDDQAVSGENSRRHINVR